MHSSICASRDRDRGVTSALNEFHESFSGQYKTNKQRRLSSMRKKRSERVPTISAIGLERRTARASYVLSTSVTVTTTSRTRRRHFPLFYSFTSQHSRAPLSPTERHIVTKDLEQAPAERTEMAQTTRSPRSHFTRKKKRRKQHEMRNQRKVVLCTGRTFWRAGEFLFVIYFLVLFLLSCSYT